MSLALALVALAVVALALAAAACVAAHRNGERPESAVRPRVASPDKLVRVPGVSAAMGFPGAMARWAKPSPLVWWVAASGCSPSGRGWSAACSPKRPVHFGFQPKR